MKTTPLAGAVCCLLLTLTVIWVEAAPRAHLYGPFSANIRHKRQTATDATATVTIANCLAEQDWALTCATCPDYTVLAADSSDCLDCDTSCATCDESEAFDGTTICTSCMEGYIMEQDPNQGNKSVCSGCASFCKKCTVKSECDSDGCIAKTNGQGTVYSTEDRTCKACASNCMACTVAGECSASSCMAGYALSPLKKCDACSANALTCAFTGEVNHAKTCMEGYAVKPGDTTTAATCEKCPNFCLECAWSTDLSRTSCAASKCMDRFVRMDDGTCSSCADNCKKCSEAGKCDDGQCDENYGWYQDGCVQCPTKCLSCTPDSTTGAAEKCDKCMDTFMLTELPTCDFCPSNCHSCSINDQGATICKSTGCDTGYAYRSTDSTCQKCPNNCQACVWDNADERTECSTCAALYAKGKSGQCYNCPDNCNLCKDRGDGDTYCEYNHCVGRSAFKAVDETCPPCADNCNSCFVDQSENVKCSSCDTGFTVSTDGMSCEACPDNCKLCGISAVSGGTFCYDQQCNTGFYRDAEGECNTCSDGCMSCTSSTCLECKANYVMDTSTSPATCLICTNCVGTCTYANNQAECSACEEGYMRDTTGKCRACPTGCKTCSVDGLYTTCDDASCKIGFTQVTKDSCIACPPGCSACTYSNSNILTCSALCMTGYAFSGGQCLPCPANCDSCTYRSSNSQSMLECDTCASTFKEVDKLCRPCQSECSMCNTNGAGKCDSTSCPTGTVYNADTLQCDQCASSCSGCTTAGTCDGGSCDTGFRVNQDSCIKCDSNCKTCTDVGCSTCDYGYALDPTDANSCVKCHTGCEFCSVVNGEPVCEWGQCKPEYVMSEDRSCVACSLGCAVCKWDGSKSVCEGVCKTGFAVKPDGTCEKCPDNCHHCKYEASGTKCYQEGCKDNFKQNAAGTCEACDVNCVSGCVTSGVGKCDSQCADTFYLDTATKICTACGVGTTCKTCLTDGSGTCLTCPNAEEAVIGVVCAACDTNCIPANGCDTADMCDKAGSTCKAKSFMDAGDCTPCQGTCATCEDGTTCATCEAGKTLATTCADCADGACTSCNEGTGFTGGVSGATCAACPDTNCKLCAADNTKCTACVSGQRLSDGDCPGSPGVCCEACDDTVDCDQCTNDKAICTLCKADSDVLLNGGKCRKTCPKVGSDGNRVQETGADTYACITPVNTGCMVALHSSKSAVATDECLEDMCKEGYAYDPESKKCVQCLAGCRTCNAAGTCLYSSCEEGYGRESNGECSKCPVGCDRCSWDSVANGLVCDADMCSMGYEKVETNECVKCHNGCEQCSLDALNRVKCLGGQCAKESVYIESNNDIMCFPCANNCDMCSYYVTDPTNTATTGTSMAQCNVNQCSSGFAMNPDTTACITCPDRCDQCKYSTADASTVCDVEKCESGYAQDPNTLLCQVCPTGCSVCIWDTSATDNVRCLEGGCMVGYMQTYDTSNELRCDICLDDCMRCMVNPLDSTQTICLDKQCLPGFGLTTEFNCEACSTGCLWCEIDAEGTQTCTSCSTGFVLDAGECKACPTNCNSCSYNSLSEITMCNSGACATRFAQNSMADDRGCEACPERCSQCTYSTDNAATMCVDGSCDLETGYAVVADDGTCGACSSNCLICTTNGPGKCDTCATSYRLNSELCDACSAHCSKCASAGAGKCDSNSCDARYMLDKDSKDCQACAANCHTCKTNGKALCDTNKCDDKYAYNEATMMCVKCPDKCDVCSVAADGTTACIEGQCQDYYGLKDSDKKCHTCPNECISCTDSMDDAGAFTGNLRCTACNKYFILNGGQCGSCPINCEICSYETGFGLRCSSCKAGHAMDPDKNCLPCPSSCSECSYDVTTSKTMCAAGKCAEGYAVAADGSCKSCADHTYSNCATCTDVIGNSTSVSTCTACKTGYTKQDDDMACLACPTSCGTCEDKPGKYCELCDESTLRSANKEICGFQCHACANGDAGCEKFPSGTSLGSTVCTSCWMWGNSSNGETTGVGRGCGTQECTGDYLTGFCQDTGETNKRCEKCCTTENCNTEDIGSILNSAADARPSLLLLLLVSSLAVLGRTL